ncbi:MAG TPA: hypothetical protein VGT03_11810 [Candidatus Acidoferrales bacterium]|nr:hypothetical protein [Candidatus Acidoferrales bacterium]
MACGRKAKAGGVNPPLREAVVAGAEELEEAEVSEDLELLADFVADVAIIWMKGFELVFECIDIGEIEFLFAE